MSTENTSLQVVDLESIRDDRTLFSKLNFELCTGQVVQIEGANGSGKTTLLRMICGMLL
ncbi:MAG: ATP-binding cassette domain-containing protein, partial [Gammaproteobacteria bacterium]|nr:ATP-binding cassette domain-containing protein [Gammaproteobacteria bacterium]